MTIALICITVIAVLVAIYCATTKKKVDTAASNANKKIYEETERLKAEYELYKTTNETILSENNKLTTQIEEGKKHLSTIQNAIDNQQEMSSNAFKNYCDILEKKYKEVEEEHDMEIEALNTAYSNLQLKLLREADEVRSDLDKIKATRTAAIEAARREKDIENNLTFYCLDISDADKRDIAKLEALKPSLNKPRVLSMLIWQTWFQKPLKALSANVVGATDATGIYKITNIKTKECYIGQAMHIKERWAEHAKCGLGIDTPAGNKLYKAIQEFGLWNFSVEVLEECPREQLNEKEKYYIDLYSSYDYGYNSTRGNK
mgnify:FL=1